RGPGTGLKPIVLTPSGRPGERERSTWSTERSTNAHQGTLMEHRRHDKILKLGVQRSGVQCNLVSSPIWLRAGHCRWWVARCAVGDRPSEPRAPQVWSLVIAFPVPCHRTWKHSHTLITLTDNPPALSVLVHHDDPT